MKRCQIHAMFCIYTTLNDPMKEILASTRTIKKFYLDHLEPQHELCIAHDRHNVSYCNSEKFCLDLGLYLKF